METNNIKLFSGEFFLPVDYDEDFDDLLEKGNYDHVSDDINEENFQSVVQAEQSGNIIQVARFIGSRKGGICDLIGFPYRQATLREFASYALIKPSGPLFGVAYGSVYKIAPGKMEVPYFSDENGRRRLHGILSELDYEKEPYGRLLVIRMCFDLNEYYRSQIEFFS